MEFIIAAVVGIAGAIYLARIAVTKSDEVGIAVPLALAVTGLSAVFVPILPRMAFVTIAALAAMAVLWFIEGLTD